MIILTLTLLLLTSLCCTSALAAGGDVAGAVEQTWTEAAKQIKSVVEKVVFPALDMILAIAFFVKLGGAYATFGLKVFFFHLYGSEIGNPGSSSGPLPPSSLPA